MLSLWLARGRSGRGSSQDLRPWYVLLENSDPEQRFSDDFVASRVMGNRVEDSHGWRMVRRGDDPNRFAIYYERLHLEQRNKSNFLFFMRGELATCSELSDAPRLPRN